MRKKIFVLALAMFILFGFYTTHANTITFSIGTIESQETIVVEDITYNKYILTTDTSDYYVIHNLEVGRYSDFDVVLHDKLYGANAQGKATVLEIALDYEAKTGKVVYAAVNGDFFSDLPIGYYAVDNNLLHIGGSTLRSFGFTDAHKTKVGQVEYGYKINVYDASGDLIESVPINQMNGVLSEGEIGVYTNDLSSHINGTNIAKLKVTDELILNDSQFHYEGDIITNANDFLFDDLEYTLQSDEFVIAAKGDSTPYQDLLSSLTNASRIAIYPYPINDWENMDYIVGGYQILLDRGTMIPEPIHGSETATHPRTTIAVNREGTIGLTVVDGRQVNMPGVTLRQLANINQDLGYYTALELDGGGSSTCLLRNLETDELEVMNTPSDGYLRSVVNAVLIVGDPIEDVVTTETTTETLTTFVPTTTSATTSTNVATDITTRMTTTSIPTTLPTQSTTVSSTNTTTNTEISRTSGCGSRLNVNVSTSLLGVVFLMGFLWYRRN